MYSGVPVNYRTNSQLVFSTGCTVTLRPQQAIGGIRKASCFRHFTERHTSQKLFMFDFFFYSRFCFVLFCSTHSHFYRKICTPAYSCSHPVSQSCSSSAVQKNPKTHNQTNKSRRFRSRASHLWACLWRACWFQMGWFNYFRNCRSPGIFYIQPSIGFTRNGAKKTKQKPFSERSYGRSAFVDERGMSVEALFTNMPSSKASPSPTCFQSSLR